MSSSAATTVGGMVVVTQVQPAPYTAAAFTAGAAHEHQYAGIKKFNKGRPQVLGTIQIMVGLLVLLLGITFLASYPTIYVYGGSFVWGAALYIAAGSLTLAAGIHLTPCLVKSALIVSVIASVAAAIIFIIHTMYAILVYRGPYMGEGMLQGVSGVLAVFSLLELVVSITVAAYACTAMCCCNAPTRVLVVPSTAVASGEAAAMNTEQVPLQVPLQVQFLKSSGEEEAMAHPPPYSSW